MDTSKAKQSLSEALQALERLEQALSEQNHRAIGAEQARLKQALLKLQQELESKPERHKKRSQNS